MTVGPAQPLAGVVGTWSGCEGFGEGQSFQWDPTGPYLVLSGGLNYCSSTIYNYTFLYINGAWSNHSAGALNPPRSMFPASASNATGTLTVGGGWKTDGTYTFGSQPTTDNPLATHDRAGVGREPHEAHVLIAEGFEAGNFHRCRSSFTIWKNR